MGKFATASAVAGVASAGIGYLIITDQLDKRRLMLPSSLHSTLETASTTLASSAQSLASSLNVNFDVASVYKKPSYKVGSVEMSTEESIKAEAGEKWNEGVKKARAAIAKLM